MTISPLSSAGFWEHPQRLGLKYPTIHPGFDGSQEGRFHCFHRPTGHARVQAAYTPGHA